MTCDQSGIIESRNKRLIFQVEKMNPKDEGPVTIYANEILFKMI